MIGAILLLIALLVVVAFAVWIALQVSEALRTLVLNAERAWNAVENIHSRDMDEMSRVLDRLMAKDFTAFKDYDLASQAMEGGVEELTREERARERPWTFPPEPVVEESERPEGSFDPVKEGLPR